MCGVNRAKGGNRRCDATQHQAAKDKQSTTALMAPAWSGRGWPCASTPAHLAAPHAVHDQCAQKAQLHTSLLEVENKLAYLGNAPKDVQNPGLPLLSRWPTACQHLPAAKHRARPARQARMPAVTQKTSSKAPGPAKPRSAGSWRCPPAGHRHPPTINDAHAKHAASISPASGASGLRERGLPSAPRAASPWMSCRLPAAVYATVANPHGQGVAGGLTHIQQGAGQSARVVFQQCKATSCQPRAGTGEKRCARRAKHEGACHSYPPRRGSEAYCTARCKHAMHASAHKSMTQSKPNKCYRNRWGLGTQAGTTAVMPLCVTGRPPY